MMPQRIHEATGKMTQLRRKILRINIRWSILERESIFCRFFHFIWDRILVCSIGKPVRYRRLSRRSSSPVMDILESGLEPEDLTTTCSGYDTDSDIVDLKITLLGDCQIGKTSFVIKYAGDEPEKRGLQMSGLNLMDKTLIIRGAKIAFRIWDVGGENMSLDHVPIACKDAVAILFMFDLTSRCTLNSVIGWYNEARRWNQQFQFLSGPNSMILSNFP
ncbi:septum-promoting GTP-binding protein 1-like isoform X2 [Cornus florida]|uniref:septum-promoting GTP-binding protein 1-like isoform X2 n=1 Tax=Cornus florida TaxID=4283 RepID=UPI00289C96A6|nr:septum-promoting GTP-binding protein 1-like isoform X2 [Cornus florida]